MELQRGPAAAAAAVTDLLIASYVKAVVADEVATADVVAKLIFGGEQWSAGRERDAFKKTWDLIRAALKAAGVKTATINYSHTRLAKAVCTQ